MPKFRKGQRVDKYVIGSFSGNLNEMTPRDKSEAMADVMFALYEDVIRPAVLMEKPGGAVLSGIQVAERVLKVLRSPLNRWPELTKQFIDAPTDAPQHRLQFARCVFADEWYDITTARAA